MNVAALSFDLGAGSKREFRVIPAGYFKSWDGRPANGQWRLTEANARAIIATTKARGNDVSIDYEHATLTAMKTGNAAPAAGWYRSLEWRPDGLYVTDARWTEAAARMIDAKEYRFVSPVILSNEANEVTGLFNVALVNTPALGGLTDLAALSALARANPASLAARMATGFAGTGMSEQAAQHFLRVFGHTPAELRVMQPQTAAPLSAGAGMASDGFPPGWTDRSKDAFLGMTGGLTPAGLKARGA